MINSLGLLMSAMNVNYQVFDLGKRIQKVSEATFQQFENQNIPYPSPHLKHAWLCLAFWPNEAPEDSILWFIKLPLDEAGLLIQSERDRFLQQLLMGAGRNLSASQNGESFQEVLKDNPFIFTPSPEKQAFINSSLRGLLGISESTFYNKALEYFEGDLSEWKELPLQGLADIIVGWEKNRSLIESHIEQLPDEVVISICHLLENQTIDESLSQALYKMCVSVLETKEKKRTNTEKTDIEFDQSSLLFGLLRGISQSSDLVLKKELLFKFLNSDLSKSSELMAIIASRYQLDLFDLGLCKAYLKRLSEQTDSVFESVLKELLYTPSLKHHLLSILNDKSSDQNLRTAFKTFAEKVRSDLH